MPQEAVTLDKIDWQRSFPWVRLFRAFRTAIDLRMLLLACIALVALTTGDAIFTNLPFAPAQTNLDIPYRWGELPRPQHPLSVPGAVLQNPWAELWTVGSDWGIVLRPARTIVDPAFTILRANATWSDKALAWTRLLWALCVWAVTAGAMARIAAVEQAGETKVSLVASLRFAIENFLSYMTAALLPVFGIGIGWVLCLIGGWIGRLPFVGTPLLGLLWGLELVFGLMMALILIGAAAGWPLMYATISTEASDGFDGFSRAYSYVFSRPWHFLWFAVVAMAYGTVVISFISLVASLVVYLAAAGVASGLGVDATGGMLLGSPDSVGGPRLLTNTPSTYGGLGTLLAGIWIQLVGLLTSGFVVSYFWTASTYIYLLLRHVDDATDFHEVYLPQETETDDLLPLVGTAASKQPVIERPASGDFAGGPSALPAVLPSDGHPNGPAGGPSSPASSGSIAP